LFFEAPKNPKKNVKDHLSFLGSFLFWLHIAVMLDFLLTSLKKLLSIYAKKVCAEIHNRSPELDIKKHPRIYI
jgi:hypothetical protein